ncbi:hypothetical protein VTK73DRAFT_5784 [Phialemonium thermophilum]|uniref:Uncharacterized protein n=1 Tax=Phialemonium thermophilum TaxID=223376 RepID=A0ABR3V0R2_9PEZI
MSPPPGGGRWTWRPGRPGAGDWPPLDEEKSLFLWSMGIRRIGKRTVVTGKGRPCPPSANSGCSNKVTLLSLAVSDWARVREWGTYSISGAPHCHIRQVPEYSRFTYD